MIKVLNKANNIVSVSPDLIPGHLKGHNLIVYLPERDMIVLSGWRGSMACIVELVSAYMETEPREHQRIQRILVQAETSDEVLKILCVLNEIYRERRKKGEK